MQAARNVTEHATAARAIEALARLRFNDAIPLLRELLSQEPQVVQLMEVVEALGALGDAESARPIRALLARSLRGDMLIGNSTARALGQLRDRRAVPLLVKALRHRVGRLTRDAAEALVKIAGAAAAPSLIAALKLPARHINHDQRVSDLLWRLGDLPVASGKSRSSHV